MSDQGQLSPESDAQSLTVAHMQQRELLQSEVACLGCGQGQPLALLAFTAECRMVALCTRCFGEQTCLSTIATILHAPRGSNYQHAVADDPVATPDGRALLRHPAGEAAYLG